MATLKILHERHKCIGCTSCAVIHPKQWVMDESDNKSHLVGSSKRKSALFEEELTLENASEEDARGNQEAADCCPVECIHVECIHVKKE